MTASQSTFFTLLLAFAIGSVQAGLLDKLNKAVASESSQPAPPMATTAVPFENILSTSLKMAMESCQTSFRWDLWNCPSSDFLLRHISRPGLLDREDAYVQAIVTAAIVYSITKSCSASDGCGTHYDKATPCGDDTQRGIGLYQYYIGQRFGDSDFSGAVKHHNFKAIAELLKKSSAQQCHDDGACVQVLRPFEEIALAVRSMYYAGLQLANGGGENSQVMWENVPLDALVYIKESPNYCEPDAVPLWNGIRGRQCLPDSDGGEHSSSCSSMCHACGYEVKTRQLLREHQCNCQLTWGYQVQCDICIVMEEQHYCH